MAAKTDFTAEEWDALQKGVSGAGMMVSLADPGFFDTFKEIGALTKHLAEARSNSTNPLISEVAQVRSTGFGINVVATGDRDRDDPGAPIVDEHAEGEGSRRCAGVSRFRAERGEVRRGGGERHRHF